MTDHSRQDRTRSPGPNAEAILRRREHTLELEVANYARCLKSSMAELRKVRAAIKRACGDRETQI